MLLPRVGQATASGVARGWVFRGPSQWGGGLWSSPGMLLAAALAPATLKGLPLAAGGDLAKECAEIILSLPTLLENSQAPVAGWPLPG